MIVGLFALIKSFPAVSALNGGNVFRFVLPPGVNKGITVQRAGGSGDLTFDGPAMQKVRVQFDFHASTPEASDAMQTAFRTAIEGYAGTLSDGTYLQDVQWINDIDFYDNEPRQWRVASEFYLFFNL